MSKCISRKRRKNLRRFDAGMVWEIIGFSRKVGGTNKGLGEAPKAARGRSMKVRPTQSRKGVKGQLPLAGSRDSVPCGVWGNAPTVPRPTNPKEVANKGAGSAASLPVTLRVRRRAPKLLLPQASVKNQIIRLSEQIGNGMKSCHFSLRALRPGAFCCRKKWENDSQIWKNA